MDRPEPQTETAPTFRKIVLYLPEDIVAALDQRVTVAKRKHRGSSRTGEAVAVLRAGLELP